MSQTKRSATIQIHFPIQDEEIGENLVIYFAALRQAIRETIIKLPQAGIPAQRPPNFTYTQITEATDPARF